MKITRIQLRKLIEEAYKTGIPYRSALEQSDSFITGNYPEFEDTLSSVDTNQRNLFKSSLDPNRPEPDFKIKAIDDPRNGLTQRQINDLVDKEYFSYFTYAGAMSRGGMTLRQIAEEIFEYFAQTRVGGFLYDDNGMPRNQEDVEEVIRRYEEALSRPHHRQLGHIS